MCAKPLQGELSQVEESDFPKSLCGVKEGLEMRYDVLNQK